MINWRLPYAGGSVDPVAFIVWAADSAFMK